MIQTPDEERRWWTGAGPENIWGVGTWDEGIAWCTAEIAPILPETGTVLDLGCGPGRLLLPFAESYPALTFIGTDICYQDLRGANVEFLPSTGRTINLEPETLGAAYSVALLQHLTHSVAKSYVRQLGRCLKPGGKVRLQHVHGTEDSFLNHQVAVGQLEEWCEDAGLEVVASDAGHVHFQWVWVTGVKP